MNARFRGVSSSASTTAGCGKIQQLGYDPGNHVVMAGLPRAVSFDRRQIASSCSRRYKLLGACGRPGIANTRLEQFALEPKMSRGGRLTHSDAVQNQNTLYAPGAAVKRQFIRRRVCVSDGWRGKRYYVITVVGGDGWSQGICVSVPHAAVSGLGSTAFALCAAPSSGSSNRCRSRRQPSQPRVRPRRIRTRPILTAPSWSLVLPRRPRPPHRNRPSPSRFMLSCFLPSRFMLGGAIPGLLVPSPLLAALAMPTVTAIQDGLTPPTSPAGTAGQAEQDHPPGHGGRANAWHSGRRIRRSGQSWSREGGGRADREREHHPEPNGACICSTDVGGTEHECPSLADGEQRNHSGGRARCGRQRGRAAGRRVLNRYFTAINQRDYPTYASLFDQQLEQPQPESSFAAGYGTTIDSAVTFTSALGRRLRQPRGFRHGHRAGRIPRTVRNSPCDQWSITLLLVPGGTGYLIGPPPSSYHASFQAC